jgi:hypothetical protein
VTSSAVSSSAVTSSVVTSSADIPRSPPPPRSRAVTFTALMLRWFPATKQEVRPALVLRSLLRRRVVVIDAPSGRHNRCRPRPDDTTGVTPSGRHNRCRPVRTTQPVLPPSGRHNRCRPVRTTQPVSPRPDDTTGVAPVRTTQPVSPPSGRHSRCHPVRTIQPVSPRPDDTTGVAPSGQHHLCLPRPDNTTCVSPVRTTKLVSRMLGMPEDTLRLGCWACQKAHSDLDAGHARRHTQTWMLGMLEGHTQTWGLF